MSFSGTPLGQGRRLDRDTFLGKPNGKDNNQNIPRRIPASFDFSTLTAGSPPRPSSPSREAYNQPLRGSGSEPALTRFAKQKQREVEQVARPGAPQVATANPTPSKWAVKDTSVNIANAFSIEARKANGEIMPVASSHSINNAWASSSRPQSHVPRSTSVEYEEQAKQARRGPLPPNRIPGRGGSSNSLKPPSRNNRSLQQVPEGEGESEVGPNGRATSPYQAVIDAAKRALAPAAYYVRERSQDPDQSGERSQASVVGFLTGNVSAGNDTTYNYEEEEQFVKDAMQGSKADKRKRGRISVDNQAYKPEGEEEESSEEEEDGKRRRGKAKPAARVTNLPSVADGKQTKKRRTKSKANIEIPDDVSEDLSQTAIESSSSFRTSPPNGDISTDKSLSMAEETLPSIEEVPEEDIPQPEQAQAAQAVAREQSVKPQPQLRTRTRARSRSSTPARTQRFSIGGLMGRLIHAVFTNAMLILSSFLNFVGRGLGTVFNTLLNRPIQWARRAKPGVFTTLIQYAIIFGTVFSAWYLLQHPAFRSLVPGMGSPSKAPVYTPPSAPAQDISEVAARLARIEYAISGLSVENERVKARADESVKGFSELSSKLGQIEGKITAEGRRISDSESRARDTMGRTISSVRQEVEGLQAQIQAHQKQYEKEKGKLGSGADEAARAKLKGLEERLAGAESGVKEALDLGKKLASAPAAPSVPGVPGQAWWTKIMSKGKLQITAPDGQDVTGVIATLVDASVANAMNDRNSKVDFALHSGGARVIPALTSGTFEIKPQSVKGQVFGILTGNGYAIGRPPVTALHHELQNGYCWPFTGTEGQLGVALAVPAYVEEITIDHVSKDVAFDMRSAPRQMEVWGLVEGQDNLDKVNAYESEQLVRRKIAAEATGEIIDDAWLQRDLEREQATYPPHLPKSAKYLKLANFSTTFTRRTISRRLLWILRLGSLYTCLYRFRVHGKRFGQLPPPYSPELPA
ncbi:spindle pole body-associated protein sad1 [Coprinopsis sp. MPI-PUGE-AT-0042]|nr:spindle pole body-associated protein sad1 [Coprinopsis sp. MPI-PUGE-AT-0042]